MSTQQLIESVESVSALYAKLIELGNEKKDQIIQNRLNDLTQTLSKESKVLKQLGEAEKARVEAVESFQRSAGLPANPSTTLLELTKYITKASDKAEMDRVRTELIEITKTLKNLNASNQQLLKQSIELVEYSLDLLGGGYEEEVTYQRPTTQPSAVKRNGVLDTRA